MRVLLFDSEMKELGSIGEHLANEMLRLRQAYILRRNPTAIRLVKKGAKHDPHSA